MNEKARELCNAYKRQWAKNNPEKVKAQQDRYWTKKAQKAAMDVQQPNQHQTERTA